MGRRFSTNRAPECLRYIYHEGNCLIGRQTHASAVTIEGRGILKVSTLALDFDGTIAQNDALDPEVRKAIAGGSCAGRRCVAGHRPNPRGFARVVSDLHLVDAVASDNGAVICFRTANTRVFWRILREQLCSTSCE